MRKSNNLICCEWTTNHLSILADNLLFALDRNVSYYGLRNEARLGRTEMSEEELRWVEVLARLASEPAAPRKLLAGQALMLKHYCEEGPAGLKHRSAGRVQPQIVQWFRERLLRLVRAKYGGAVGERFGPTLTAEHLESKERLCVHAETLRLWTQEQRPGIGLGRRVRSGNVCARGGASNGCMARSTGQASEKDATDRDASVKKRPIGIRGMNICRSTTNGVRLPPRGRIITTIAHCGGRSVIEVSGLESERS